jgi:hypothetical protein
LYCGQQFSILNYKYVIKLNNHIIKFRWSSFKKCNMKTLKNLKLPISDQPFFKVFTGTSASLVYY